MNYATIKKVDVANGVGVRCSLFVSGCTHHCKGCFNPETWNFNFGERFTDAVGDDIIGELDQSYNKGLSLLGGEPFDNLDGLVPFVRKVAELFPDKTIWCYSGYTFEQILKNDLKLACEYQGIELLELLDVLVDGEFVESKKNLKIRFRGSENQRIIDVQKSLSSGEVVLWEDPDKDFAMEEVFLEDMKKEKETTIKEKPNVNSIESGMKVLSFNKEDLAKHIAKYEQQEALPPKIGRSCGRDC